MSFIRKIKKGKNVYLAEVENKRIDGKIVQHHIRYVGKEVDSQTILSTSISDISIDKVKLYGPLLVLNHLANEIRLPSLLGKYAPEILSLVYAHCLDYNSVNKMSRWFERTDLNMLLNLEGLTEAKLLNALDFLESKNIEQLQKELFENVKYQYKLSSTRIIYDVTNTYFCGKKCSISQFGKDKEGVKGRPLIQIGLVVTFEHGIPIFHKVFDGNIHDSKTLRDITTTFQDSNIQSGLFVFDRGITSKINLYEIKNILKWDVLCGLALNSKLKTTLRSMLKTEKIVQYSNRVRLKNTIFYVIAKKYTHGNVEGKIFFCFNEQAKIDLKESRYDEISNAQKLLRKGKKIKNRLRSLFDEKDNLLMEQLEKVEEFEGYLCIFTTEASISKFKVVSTYFDKDLVEKAFHSLKGVIKLRPIRHWLHNRVIAHVLICYLAYLLLSLLKYRLMEIEISPIEALQELDSVYKVYMKDEKNNLQFSRIVTLTEKQDKILKTIDKDIIV